MSEVFSQESSNFGGDRVSSQVFDEDPVLHDGKGSAPWTEQEFVEYFKAREFAGSPSEGYLLVANALVSDLHQMYEHIQSLSEVDDPQSLLHSLAIPIPLRPLSDRKHKFLEASTIYADEETKAYHAFRGQLDFMLRTKAIAADPPLDSFQFTLYSARYYHPASHSNLAMYLLEGRGKDERGGYTQLWLRNQAPKSMLNSLEFSNQDDERPFFTTAETEGIVLDLYRELGEWALGKAA